jgi:rsbT co-antagonist protein RsbR
MKAADFDLSRDLRLSPDTGIATLHGTRILIFNADALGLLRQTLQEDLGWHSARDTFLRFGYQTGHADFLQTQTNYEFEDEFELLSAGPAVHSWKGIVHAAPTELSFDRAAGTFRFTGIWRNSYEAEQYLHFNPIASEPVCWSLAGYAAGWCTAFFGRPLIAIETACTGCGDDVCKWLIEPPEAWGEEAEPYVRALNPFWR